MDFALIEEHPWYTTLVIVGGALVLYLYFRRGSSSSAEVAYQGGGYQTAAADPNAGAYNLQGQQIQASLAGLQIQTQGALAMKQLDVDSANTSVAAQLSIANLQTAAAAQLQMQQTAAELQLGLGSQQSTVDLARISANVQLASISAIERAYGVLNGPTGPNNVTGAGIPINPPVYNAGGAPGSTATPPVYVTLQPPPVRIGSDGAVTLGAYGLDPAGGGFHCSPLDSSCVAAQNSASNAYVSAVAGSQVRSSLQRDLANYQISVDAGVITPAQLAAMKALQAQLAA